MKIISSSSAASSPAANPNNSKPSCYIIGVSPSWDRRCHYKSSIIDIDGSTSGGKETTLWEEKIELIDTVQRWLTHTADDILTANKSTGTKGNEWVTFLTHTCMEDLPNTTTGRRVERGAVNTNGKGQVLENGAKNAGKHTDYTRVVALNTVAALKCCASWTAGLGGVTDRSRCTTGKSSEGHHDKSKLQLHNED